MHCLAVDSFYLKANGEIPCWCSPGEHHPMLRLDPVGVHEIDVVRDILNGKLFRTMRRKLHEEKLPFGYCRGCWFLTPSQAPLWERVDPQTFELREIRTFQVESSYHCNVDCPLCVRFDVRKQTKDPPHQLDLAMYKKVIDDFARNGIKVGEIWFSGRGEPLMNPAWPVMVRYGRDRLGARMTCHTNGNFKFRDELATCGINEIEIALDGVQQDEYERYRRRGQLHRVLEFARDFVAAKRRHAVEDLEIVWKMILFEWNSSDDAIRSALRLTDEIGVDKIQFMNTDTPGGISFRDGGERFRAISALVEEERANVRANVELMGFHSAYGEVAEITVDLELRREKAQNGDAPRLLLFGRLFNQMIEDRTAHLQVRIEGEEDLPPRILVDTRIDLAERTELVESLQLPTHDLAKGDYRVCVSVSDPNKGILFSEAACDFSVN